MPKQAAGTADKLVKVYDLRGKEEWLLIHLEIQSLPEAQNVFAKRMFTYCHG